MSCNSCTTNNHKKGCGSSGNCTTSSCNTGKLNVFDWLANTQLPGGLDPFDCVEVRFKNSRKEFFKNTENLPLQIGDVVTTEAPTGHDVGIVTLTGELVRLQMRKNKIDWEKGSIPKVYRKSNQRDIDIWQEFRAKEEAVKKQSRELAIALGLEMKISDVEFQGDGSKATFYYTAEGRVDFRQLIKDLARVFSVRIEMRQIGFRQEAARLGGIGSCGRELCCSTWLTDFRTVSTSAAKYQQLSLNPQKLAGQCGKLKCCINFELDTYLDALKDFPKTETKLFTEKGRASCQKIDIFKRLMWFTYDDEPAVWYKLSVDKVKEIIAINHNHLKIKSLDEYAIVANNEANVVSFGKNNSEMLDNQEDSITRFDTPKQKKKQKNKAKNNSNNNQHNQNLKKEKETQVVDNQGISNEQKPKEQQQKNKQKQFHKKPKEQKEQKEGQVAPNNEQHPKDMSQNNPKHLKDNKNRSFKKKPAHNRNNTQKES